MIEIAPATLYTEGLGSGYLDVVHVPTVPKRLKDPVGEPEHQKVLDGLLPEIMVDAVDLSLIQDFQKGTIELACAFKVGSKGLFDDDSRVRLGGRRNQARTPQLPDDGRKRGGRSG